MKCSSNDSCLRWVRRRGLSLAELLVAILIFACASIPIALLTGRQTSETYSIGKHLMAGFLASSLLDRTLAMNFDQCRTELEDLDGKWKKVLDDPNLVKDLLTHSALAGTRSEMEDDSERQFRSFQFRIVKVESNVAKDWLSMFTVQVTVSWQLSEGNETSRQELMVEAIKFNEGQL